MVIHRNLAGVGKLHPQLGLIIIRNIYDHSGQIYHGRIFHLQQVDNIFFPCIDLRYAQSLTLFVLILYYSLQYQLFAHLGYLHARQPHGLLDELCRSRIRVAYRYDKILAHTIYAPHRETGRPQCLRHNVQFSLVQHHHICNRRISYSNPVDGGGTSLIEIGLI